jgi:hypothetical protein
METAEVPIQQLSYLLECDFSSSVDDILPLIGEDVDAMDLPEVKKRE